MKEAARGLIEDGRWADSVSFAKLWVELAPTSSSAYMRLGEALHGSGDHGASRRAYQQALAHLKDGSWYEARTLAEILKESGDRLGSAHAFRKAVELLDANK